MSLLLLRNIKMLKLLSHLGLLGILNLCSHLRLQVLRRLSSSYLGGTASQFLLILTLRTAWHIPSLS
jgi:hypothetical protein